MLVNKRFTLITKHTVVNDAEHRKEDKAGADACAHLRAVLCGITGPNKWARNSSVKIEAVGSHQKR
jgi:hypothetical protein